MGSESNFKKIDRKNIANLIKCLLNRDQKNVRISLIFRIQNFMFRVFLIGHIVAARYKIGAVDRLFQVAALQFLLFSIDCGYFNLQFSVVFATQLHLLFNVSNLMFSNQIFRRLLVIEKIIIIIS